jgi:hypothetical protein
LKFINPRILAFQTQLIVVWILDTVSCKLHSPPLQVVTVFLPFSTPLAMRVVNAAAIGDRKYTVVAHAFKVLPSPHLEGREILIELSDVYCFCISLCPEGSEL